MKKILFILLTFALVFACKKDEVEVEYRVDTDTVEVPKPVIVDVVFADGSAKVSIPTEAEGVTCSSASSSDVVLSLDTAIHKEYIYRVTGKTTSGSLTINSDYKLTMLLAGADITSTGNNPAINIKCGKRISVVLQENISNHLSDSPFNREKGALYTKGHLEFEGAGTLYLEGHTKHALAAKEYIQLKKSTGSIIITSSVGDGIHCGKGDKDPENNYFKMNGGTLEFGEVAGDLIDADDYGNVFINGGTITYDLKNADSKGIKADSLFVMNGGSIIANVQADNSIAIQANYAVHINGGTILGTLTADGTNGIKGNKSKDSYTVLDGGNVHISGGTITFDVLGSSKCYGIYAEKNITATGGKVELSGPENNAPGYKAQEISGTQYFNWSNK